MENTTFCARTGKFVSARRISSIKPLISRNESIQTHHWLRCIVTKRNIALVCFAFKLVTTFIEVNMLILLLWSLIRLVEWELENRVLAANATTQVHLLLQLYMLAVLRRGLVQHISWNIERTL